MRTEWPFRTLFASVVGTLVWSGISPTHPWMWLLEIQPVIIGCTVLAVTYRRFPLTPLVYGLLAALAMLHLVGVHDTHSHVPLGDWLRQVLALARNPFDRIVHVVVGVAVAMLCRELLLRATPLADGPWVSCLSVSLALSFSAFYELLEWLAWVLILLQIRVDNVLGAQGDPWDTQWDMASGLLGGLLAIALLTRCHDRYLRQPCPITFSRPPGSRSPG